MTATNPITHPMRRAIELARLSVGATSPNPPVGAVLAKGGRIVARAERTLKEADAPERRAVSPEEIYGAAAHAIKAFARARGWPHHSHEALKAIADHVGEAAAGKVDGAENISPLFSDASELHRNYYNDYLSPAQIRMGRKRLRRFLSLMRKARRQIALDAPPPRDARYRARAMDYLRTFHQPA